MLGKVHSFGRELTVDGSTFEIRVKSFYIRQMKFHERLSTCLLYLVNARAFLARTSAVADPCRVSTQAIYYNYLMSLTLTLNFINAVPFACNQQQMSAH